MGKSQNTIRLEAEIAKIESKEEALKEAFKELNGCETHVKSTYNNNDTDHVRGDKYDQMYEAVSYTHLDVYKRQLYSLSLCDSANHPQG